MTSAQAETPPVRDRSSEIGTVLRAEYLPPIEIAAAAKLVLKESGEVGPDDLVRAVARLFGFQRVGTDLSEAIRNGLSN
jgi:hypothetical protein